MGNYFTNFWDWDSGGAGRGARMRRRRCRGWRTGRRGRVWSEETAGLCSAESIAAGRAVNCHDYVGEELGWREPGRYLRGAGASRRTSRRRVRDVSRDHTRELRSGPNSSGRVRASRGGRPRTAQTGSLDFAQESRGPHGPGRPRAPSGFKKEIWRASKRARWG